MFGPGYFISSGGVCFVDDIDLRGVNGPFAIETHARSHLCITTAGFIVTNRQRDAIDDGDAGRSSSGDAFGFGIVVVEELLSAQFPGAYVPCEICHAENPDTHARGPPGGLLCI